jgi:tetratricopeptide (TPR) repeat protein
MPSALAQNHDEWLAKIDRGWQMCTRGNYAEAEKLLQEAVAESKKFGDEDRRYAVSLASLAWVQQHEGKTKEADVSAYLAHSIFSKSTDTTNVETVRGLHALAQVRQAQKKYDDAEKLYQSALALSRDDKVYGSKHPVVGEILCTFASLHDAQGKFGLADAQFREGFTILEAAELKESRARLAACFEGWARHYRLQGNYTQALAKLTKALEVARQVFGAEHAEVARLEHDLGVLEFQQGKRDEALAHFQASRALREKSGQDSLGLAQVLHNQAIVLGEQKKYAEAKSCLEQALKLRQKEKGEQNQLAASTLHALANLAKQQGQFEEAEKLYEQSMKIKEKVFSPDDLRLADDLDQLAALAKKRDKPVEAFKLLRRALEIRTKVLGSDHRAVASTLHNLANIYREQAQYKEAEPLYQKALDIRAKALGDEHPLLIPILEHYAQLLQASKQTAKAQEVQDRIKKIQAAAAEQ